MSTKAPSRVVFVGNIPYGNIDPRLFQPVSTLSLTE